MKPINLRDLDMKHTARDKIKAIVEFNVLQAIHPATLYNISGCLYAGCFKYFAT